MAIFNSYVSLPRGICVYPLVNLMDSPETNDEPRTKSQGSQPAAAGIQLFYPRNTMEIP